MKHTFFQSGIVFVLLVVLIYAAPAFCLNQTGPTPAIEKPEATNYSTGSFGFLAFYNNQASRLQSNMHRLLNQTGLHELLLKQMIITTDFPGHRPSVTSSALPTRFEHVEIKADCLTDPARQSRVAGMYENLRSPVLAPYKYKTTNNALLSLIVPIAATNHLTIIPIISYAFTVNGSDRNDVRDKGIISPIDKEGAIIYGGINLSYSF